MSHKKIVPPPLKKLQRLKLKLQQLLPKAKKLVLTTLSLALTASAFGYLTLKAPEIHSMYLRHSVGEKVYMIKGKLDGGGGTGFAIKAPSGQSYIVTNSHVCAGVAPNGGSQVLVVNDAGEYMPRRIIQNSDFTDLCLIEGMPGVEGLSLSKTELFKGEQSYIIGHPRLRPLSVSKGEIVGQQDVAVLDYVLPGNPLVEMLLPDLVKDLACNLPKNQIVEEVTPLGPVKFCLDVTKNTYTTTILIFPGNSGSPMVDMFGNVQGVAFASDGTNWAQVVSMNDLTKFLSHY